MASVAAQRRNHATRFPVSSETTPLDLNTETRGTMRTISWLDVKLGVRMFAKHPGLSLVSVVGLAVAIAVGAGYFIAFGPVLDSTLPFDDEGRMVVVRTTTVRGPAAGGDGLSTVYDFERWSQELKSIANLGAFREDSRNLITADGRAYPVRVASMTASGFAVTGAAPVRGRTLLPDDERATAPRVVVIGYEEWQRRFNGDSAILGRLVRLDETPHTVVGVMPQGFGFPINHHYWVPLRAEELDRSAGAAPAVTVFGRLAAGYSLENARAELKMTGERMAAALPHTHKDLRPQAQSYARAFVGLDAPGAELAVRTIQFGFSLLLLAVAVNVSIPRTCRSGSAT